MAVRVQKRPRGPRSDVKLICNQLRTLAFEKGPGAKMPTVRDLCLSLGTHARALDDALEVLEEQQILTRRQGSGIFVSQRLNRKKIAVLLAFSYFELPGTSPFWNALYRMFIAEAQRRSAIREVDYEFIIEADAQDSSRLQDSLITAAKRGQVHGIVAVGTMGAMAEYADGENIPIVSYAVDGNWCVIQDTLEFIRLGVDTLWGQGCRRIGYWSPRLKASEKSTDDYDDSIKELRGAIEAHGADLDQVYCLRGTDFIEDLSTIGTYQEQGYRLGMRVFGGSAPKPDGIVIADDMMTSGAIAAAYKLGIRLGEDIRIATHANAGSTVLFGFEQYLSLIEYSPERIVHALCDMVETLVAGGLPDQQYVKIKPVIRRAAV